MSLTVIQRAPASMDGFSNFDIHPVLKRILSARGVQNGEALNHALDRLLPPAALKNIEQAVAVIADTVERQAKIVIVGDFDADGATSTSVAVLALRSMGAQQVGYLVPNRCAYGYGLTPPLVHEAAKQQPQLLITVDNGISSIEGVAAANQLGMQVVVTDHHLPGERLPDAAAIVNPNQPGCDFPSKQLAGVGVIFYVMVALRRELQQRDWFARANITAPNMAQFLDLVALGTVADVVPLDRNNRILVSQGLARIRAGQCRPGILALLQLGKRDPLNIISTDLGFAVGPRLNAAGRLEDMSVGIECLLTNDAAKASLLAQQLHDLNQTRKEIEGDMQADAKEALAALRFNETPAGICVFQAHWHQGVIGIVASRLKAQFSRPTIVFAQADDEHIKGSARSVSGVHIRDVLAGVDALHPGLIISFGGHAMAAGLTLAKQRFDEFHQAFVDFLQQHYAVEQLSESLYSDGELEPEFLNVDLAQAIRDCLPWGQQCEEPQFQGEFNIVQRQWLGDKHLKMQLSEVVSGKLVDAIAFNQQKSEWPLDQKRVALLYRLDVNRFQQRRQLQLMVQQHRVLSV